MKQKLTFNALLELALFLTLAPIAFTSTWYVNGLSGEDSNNCKSATTACKSIGHAIALAHSGDTVMVAAATYTENLAISISLKIIGSGASPTIIDGGGVDRVVSIFPTTTVPTVVLSGLTIRNGLSVGGGGVDNDGTLTINNSTVSGNRANRACTIHPPRCFPGLGGGIFNSRKLTINNSTVGGNTVIGDGGGIFNNGGTLTINNSTISGNSAYNGGYGGGIYSYGSATLQNSIVAKNLGGNCRLSITSNGYNMSSDGTCNFSNSGDRNNTNPMLGTLQNNGGPTWTMALMPGSPAIDAGNPSGCTDGSGHLLTTDQRGMLRPDPEDKTKTGCDVGAYETQSY